MLKRTDFEECAYLWNQMTAWSYLKPFSLPQELHCWKPPGWDFSNDCEIRPALLTVSHARRSQHARSYGSTVINSHSLCLKASNDAIYKADTRSALATNYSISYRTSALWYHGHFRPSLLRRDNHRIVRPVTTLHVHCMLYSSVNLIRSWGHYRKYDQQSRAALYIGLVMMPYIGADRSRSRGRRNLVL